MIGRDILRIAGSGFPTVRSFVIVLSSAYAVHLFISESNRIYRVSQITEDVCQKSHMPDYVYT